MKRDNATVPCSLTVSTDKIRAYEREKGAKIDNRNPEQRLIFSKFNLLSICIKFIYFCNLYDDSNVKKLKL